MSTPAIGDPKMLARIERVAKARESVAAIMRSMAEHRVAVLCPQANILGNEHGSLFLGALIEEFTAQGVNVAHISHTIGGMVDTDDPVTGRREKCPMLHVLLTLKTADGTPRSVLVS